MSGPAPALPGQISGSVTIGSLPVVGALATTTNGSVSNTARTGDDGTFWFGDLTAGEYTVGATAASVSCVSQTVTLPAGGVAAVTLPCETSADFTGGSGIYLTNADGSDATWLTRGNRPDWSPDGVRIAFDRDGIIYVINVDGSSEIALHRGVDPAWSPGGNRIVFADAECPSSSCFPADHGISVMEADGSGATRLIRGDFVGSFYSLGVGEPTWSPDGETIAFNAFGDEDILPAQIYVMKSDGSDPRRLTLANGDQFAESDPAWSPDGSTIAFWSYGYGVAVVAGSGGTPNTIYQNFPFVSYGAKPNWHPNNHTLLFTAGLGLGSQSGPFIYVVGSGGGQPRLHIAGGYDAVWSPDGERIAFAHDNQ